MSHPILYFILIGALVGMFGGILIKRSRSGKIGNTIIGIVGALIGRYLFDLLEFNKSEFVFGPYLLAAACSLIALWIMDVVRGRRRKKRQANKF